MVEITNSDSLIKSVQTLEIDLDKKNILIIEYSELPDQRTQEDVMENLQKWFRSDNAPLYVLSCESGVEIRLEKIDNR